VPLLRARERAGRLRETSFTPRGRATSWRRRLRRQTFSVSATRERSTGHARSHCRPGWPSSRRGTR
jgi:hypothetical protein